MDVPSRYDAFAGVYDAWSSHMTEDVDFYVGLAREAEGPIVELAVGNGRVAIPVARETGRTVIGVDSSPAMLAQARERAATADSTSGSATSASSSSTSPRHSSTARSALSCTSRRGTTSGSSSNESRLRCGRGAVSPGTPSC